MFMATSVAEILSFVVGSIDASKSKHLVSDERQLEF